MPAKHTELEFSSKDVVIRYKGPAICSLIIACIIGIVALCVFVHDSGTRFIGILPLSVTLYELTGLLAGVLGFRLKKNE